MRIKGNDKNLSELFMTYLSDQASSHYAKEVQDWLNSKKIELLSKKINPYAPKTRPVEDF